VPWNRDLPLRLPNLARVAARGVRFTRALRPSPLCAPSRACLASGLASGLAYERCGVPGNDVDYPLDQPTYYQALRDAGYRVAGDGKVDLHKATLDWGLDGARRLRERGVTEGIDDEGKLDAIASYTASGTQPRGPYMAYLHGRGLAETHARDFQRRGSRGTEPTPLPEDAYSDNWIAENGLRLLRGFPRGSPGVSPGTWWSTPPVCTGPST
jgi:arylsulfatase